MKQDIVVAPQSEAAEIARSVLREGGNAFDAAVAGAFAQGVVDPHRCGIGGFGAAACYHAETGKVESITFFGRAGSRATAGMWKDIYEGAAPDGFGYVLAGKVNDVGYQSVTVPGMVAGTGAIHERFGSLPWGTLLEGPAALASEGFLVGPQLAAFWRRPGLFGRVSTRDRLGITEAGARIWLPEGEPPQAGDVVRQPLLAETYRHLARAGPSDFYTGALAETIAADWRKHSALLTASDLAEYRVNRQEPLKHAFLGRELHSTPLPGGGVALFQALLAADIAGLFEREHNSAAYVDGFARIFSAVQRDRTGFQADPGFEDVDPVRFLSPAYIERMLESFDRDGGEGPDGARPAESTDTTQLAVADREGNAIIFSHSLGYGSGVFTPGLGFMFNNCMSGFDPLPGRPNSIAAGKARSTALAQTIALVDGRPVLATGAPGGSHITACLAQGLMNHFHFGFDLQDAVCRPRFDAYRRTLLLESRMPYTLEKELEKRWTIKRSPHPFGMVGRMYGIAFGETGPRPGYDPGEPGTAR